MAGTPRRKVLVVDDDPSWRSILVLELEELGDAALEASDGAEALQLLEQEDCSVMLLDLRMPGLDGRAVVARLPSKRTREVLLTSAGMEEVQQALTAQPHYDLPKSAGRAELALMLQSLDA